MKTLATRDHTRVGKELFFVRILEFTYTDNTEQSVDTVAHAEFSTREEAQAWAAAGLPANVYILSNPKNPSKEIIYQAEIDHYKWVEYSFVHNGERILDADTENIDYQDSYRDSSGAVCWYDPFKP